MSADDRLATEAAALMPDREMTVPDPETGGEITVTVREYRFAEGLKAQALARDLIADIADLAAGEEEKFTPAALNAILGDHGEAWTDLVVLSCGLDRKTIEALREPHATALSMAVWDVNAGFFTTRILAEQIGRDALTMLWASLISSTPSPMPDTGGPH